MIFIILICTAKVLFRFEFEAVGKGDGEIWQIYEGHSLLGIFICLQTSAGMSRTSRKAAFENICEKYDRTIHPNVGCQTYNVCLALCGYRLSLMSLISQ